MSEHDTFDLDRAFESLTNDVSGASRPPGARNAITRSRRRRTTLASVAGVAVLALAAAALQLNTSDRSAQPTTGVDDPLPAAHVFNAAALTAATEGWTSAWQVPTKESANPLNAVEVATCLDQLDDRNSPNPPKDTGDLIWVDGQQGITFGELADFTGNSADVDTTWNFLADGLDGCATANPAGQLSWQGGRARSWGVSDKGKTGYLWLARQGDTVGILMMGGVAETIPEATSDAVMTALVAGLQSSDSFKNNSGSLTSSGTSSASAMPEVSLGSVDEGAFAEALGTWQSGWRRDAGAKVDASALPCLGGGVIDGGISGEGTSLGLNGSVEVDAFDSAATAASSFQGLGSALSSCNAIQWTVREVERTGASPVLVATSPDRGGIVAWAVQSGSGIGTIAIAGGVSTDPPDGVSQAVAGVIAEAVAPVAGSGQPRVATSSASPAS